jgi:hypothetical protein
MRLLQQRVLLPALIVGTTLLCQAQPLWFGTPDTAAKVINLTGQVSVLKDSVPWALNVGSTVQVKQMIVTGADGFAIFEVSDGSRFEVYPNSRVIFRTNPANLGDLLELWLGRVKIHIQKLSGKPNYNRVTTPTAVISVRGTVFDVSAEDENSTLVSVDEGQVAVQHLFWPSKDPKLLNAGEYLRVYRDQPLARRGPNRDAIIQQGLRAATEALYRIIYRSPQTGVGPGRVPTTGGGGGGAPLPGDTDTTPPPPPPPPPANN